MEHPSCLLPPPSYSAGRESAERRTAVKVTLWIQTSKIDNFRGFRTLYFHEIVILWFCFLGFFLPVCIQWFCLFALWFSGVSQGVGYYLQHTCSSLEFIFQTFEICFLFNILINPHVFSTFTVEKIMKGRIILRNNFNII